VVVANELLQLGEVPAVPLLNAHGVHVDVLVELVHKRNCLDDVVVVLGCRELHLRTRVGVAETELGALNVALLEALEQLDAEKTHATEQILGGLVRDGLHVRELVLDALAKVLVADTERHLATALLARLRQIELQKALEVVVHDALRHVIGVLERLSRALERRKAHEVKHLAELGEIVTRTLHLLQPAADLFGLDCDLEQRIARRLLEQNVVGHGRKYIFWRRSGRVVADVGRGRKFSSN